ncbi:MAG: hypothetical protein GF421_12335 [Candidatus Aminicenantes bacterium]|nr:hypothetical protein [Candidatus Aminicenantes bacterium]
MKKMTIMISIAFLLAIMTPQAYPVSAQTSIVPEKAKWFIHLDVKKFANTQTKKEMMDKFNSDFEEEIEEIERVAQIDFFNDISNVTAIGFGEDEDDAVIAFSGNLNKQHLLSLIKEEETPVEINYGKFLIYHWNHDDYGVFVNDNLLLISEDQDAVEHVLDTLSGKNKSISTTPMGTKIESLTNDHFLVAAAADMSEMLEDEEDFPSVVLKKTEQAFFTASEAGNRLRLSLSLHTDSPETAQSLGDIITGIKSFLAMEEKIDPEMKLVKNLRMNVEGKTFFLESQATVDEFLKIFDWDF